MLRVEIKVTDTSNTVAEVKVGKDEPSNVGPSQTRAFTVPKGGSLTISEGEVRDPVVRDELGNPVTDISEGNHGNPNGMMTATIAPKMPKSGGETKIVEEDGEFVERMVTADLGKQRQGGGIDAKAGHTPGPRPKEEAPIRGKS